MGNLAEIAFETDRLLVSRPAKPPQHAAENAALRLLAREMAEKPEQVLHTLCEQVMFVCGAESAGVSLLNGIDDTAAFTWPAVSGEWSRFEGGGMPRDASPCGHVLRHDRTLIFHNVETQFPAAAGATPHIGEIMLAPFRLDGRPIGTVWAIVHSAAKRFDDEDRRLLESLAQFAAAAFQMSSAQQSARQASDQLDLVNHELAHRLKNMLAMVMALATQTLKHLTERDAVDALQNRIQALGAAHDLLVDQSWVAAPIDAIASRVLQPMADADRISLAGPSVTVGPKCALGLSLILHELATNAVKYGALSNPSGRVSFTWGLSEGDDPQLVAHWNEQGGPLVAPPGKKGFGTRLINLGLMGSGGVTLKYDLSGLQAQFEAPLRLAQESSRQEAKRNEYTNACSSGGGG